MADRTVKIKFTGESSGLDRAARAAAKSIEKVKDGASKGLSNIGDVISGVIKSPAVASVVGTAALALGATVASALGAALVAGIGVAAVAGPMAIGIMAAAKHPAVKAAFGEFGKQGSEVLKKFGAPFVQPLVRAADTFGDALKRMTPTLLQISGLVAPLVDQLAPAFASMAENSLPGIKTLIQASTPFFKIIADKAPALGTAISKFMEAIAKGGPGAEQFLKDLFNFLIWVIPKAGQLLAWLSNYYITWRNTLIAVFKVVRAAWQAFYSFFAAIGSRIGSAISSLIGAYNRFKSGASAAFNSARSAIAGAINSMSAAMNGLKSRIAGAWNSIRSTVMGAVNAIIGAWNRLRGAASRAINFAVNIPGAGAIGRLLSGRAGGGPVMPHGSYLVGERGPEILTMGSRAGSITPNHKLGGGNGGPEILNLVIDLGRGIQERISIDLREHNRQLKRAVG